MHSLRHGLARINSWRLIRVAAVRPLLFTTLSFFLGGIAPLLAADPVIRIATRPNLPPYIHDGATSGIEIDLIKAVFEEAGRPIEFVQMDRVEMFSRFESGEIEGSLTQNIAASDHGCATKWYIVHQNVGFTLRSKNITLDSLDDLSDKPVVSFHNATVFLGEAYRNAVAKNPRYKEVAPQSAHIDLLYSGEVDVILGDEWIIRYVQRQHFEKTGEYQELTVHPIMKPTLYSARFQRQETCNVFDSALRTLRRDGRYDQIVDGYHQRILVTAKTDTKD